MEKETAIYLDYNATTPVDPKVAEAMRPFLDRYFGNPSSMHQFGIQTKKAIEKARVQVSQLLNCQPDEIIFTSGGTESNNLAITGYCLANKEKGNHIITSQIEHPAVSEVCRYLEKNGFEITYLPVDNYGMIAVEDLQKAITGQTILITLMHANNETGTIQPIRELSGLAHQYGITFHTDAAQSTGKIKTDVTQLGVDLMSVAGHKLYAPKGVGLLYIKRGIKIQKLLFGANHESDLRPGTENVLEIAGLGVACEIAAQKLADGKGTSRIKTLCDRLYQGLQQKHPAIRLNGHPELRLPNTLNISFPGIEANTLLAAMPDLAASAGAACHTDRIDISSVLEAMAVPVEFAMGAIRFSLGRFTTEEEIEIAITRVASKVSELTAVQKPEPGLNPTQEIKLTQYTHGLGCACKIRPQYLERILKELEIPNDPNLLIGNNASDDAAVYKISDELALVQTVDFFTPVVDDPYDFGAIAAANSLSDIYAMGAKPLFALNIVAFPDKRLPESVLKQILKGAEAKVKEAGIYIVGGHTIEDNEPKFGLVVTGTIHPDKLWSNAGAQPGDALILTKPLGTGILGTAMKRGLLSKKEIQELTAVMAQLNAPAAEIAMDYQVHACTDISGFGLLGHLLEMAKGSGVSASVNISKLSFLDNARQNAAAGIIPGGTKNNLDYVSENVSFDQSISQTEKYLLADAQTSGGLLFSLPPDEADNLLEKLKENKIKAMRIGGIQKKGKYKIVVKREEQ